MQRNTIYHIKDLFQFVVYVIDAIFGKDIRNTLLTMDERGIQQIVPFANQAMIEARSKAQSELMIAYWSNPKNRDAHSEAMIEYWSDPKYHEVHDYILEKLRAGSVTYWFKPGNRLRHRQRHREALSDLPSGFYSNKRQTKKLTRNQWKQSGILRQPHQCAKCGHQYESENFAYLHHVKNCNHNPCLLTSAQLQLQELPGNSPNSVKEDSQLKKNEEERTHERRLRFRNDCKNYNDLLQNHSYNKEWTETRNDYSSKE